MIDKLIEIYKENMIETHNGYYFLKVGGYKHINIYKNEFSGNWVISKGCADPNLSQFEKYKNNQVVKVTEDDQEAFDAVINAYKQMER